jgi:hypothetical protein
MKHVPVAPYLVYLVAWLARDSEPLYIWYGSTQNTRYTRYRLTGIFVTQNNCAGYDGR